MHRKRFVLDITRVVCMEIYKGVYISIRETIPSANLDLEAEIHHVKKRQRGFQRQLHQWYRVKKQQGM